MLKKIALTLGISFAGIALSACSLNKEVGFKEVNTIEENEEKNFLDMQTLSDKKGYKIEDDKIIVFSGSSINKYKVKKIEKGILGDVKIELKKTEFDSNELMGSTVTITKVNEKEALGKVKEVKFENEKFEKIK